MELDVLLKVGKNPKTSVREIAEELDSSKDTVHRIIKEHKYHPYIAQKVQHLEDNDHNRRIQLCVNFLNQSQAYSKITWTIFHRWDIKPRTIPRTVDCPHQ
ncbi:hypothetical protein ABEB36_011083 [Hypothenemus hampei]|uniref:Transposase Tc1-like domain-containing protein n=1 Tax=Hypothenemus hampei TaxID=57062 RepID=A0ABD1EG49_HYPHA